MTVHFLKLIPIYFCDILLLSKSLLCCCHTVIYQPVSWFIIRNHQSAFRIRLIACFRALVGCMARCNMATSQDIRVIPVLKLIADRSSPASCHSLSHINPNYRHCPLKPKYCSQSWLLATQLDAGCMFHPLDLCKGGKELLNCIHLRRTLVPQ